MSRVIGEVVLSPKMFERRRWVRREQRRRRRRIAAVVVLVLASAGSAFALTRSRFFAVTSIEVAGARIVDEREIVQASGLRTGQNAISVDLAVAAARVVALDGVRDARVERDGSLGFVIVVEERQPAVEVLWRQRRMVFDAEGVRMEHLVRDPEGLPVLTLPAGAEPRMPPPVVSRAMLDGTVELWSSLPQVIRTSVGSFDVDDGGMLTFQAGETTVVFGALDAIEAKLDAWRAVRRRVARDGGALARIDLRVPARPAARIA